MKFINDADRAQELLWCTGGCLMEYAGPLTGKACIIYVNRYKQQSINVTLADMYFTLNEKAMLMSVYFAAG